MNKISIVILLFSTYLFSAEIPTEHAQLHSFGKSVALNSKIIQLSNAKQSITSLLSGHLEKYFVKAGQSVKAGQKIALIESMVVSKMTADYISLNKQYISLSNNYEANKKLYDKGMLSMQELNKISIEKNSMNSKITALRSQLHTLAIDTETLVQATGNFILYAHSSGRISKLHQPLHTVIREDDVIISIIKEQAFYVESYIPLQYAGVIKTGQKLVVEYNGRSIVTHITQILPELDRKTQRIIVLSSVDEQADDLFINTFVSSTLYFEPKDTYVAVKKSALSFFNNEWVVFIPKEEHKEHANEEDSRNGHDGHVDGKDSHNGHDGHVDGKDSHDGHDGHVDGKDSHDGHDEHANEEDVVKYEARVIEIITQDDTYAAVRGIDAGEEYVSDKSYFVKSMILKSSLGEHGH